MSEPFGDNQRYDLIMDYNNELYRIQIKTGKFKEDFIVFPTASSSYHRGGKRNSYKEQVEFFGVYCSQNNEVYIIPVNEVPNNVAHLRVNPPKNNQIRGVRWARDYTIDAQLLKLQS